MSSTGTHIGGRDRAGLLAAIGWGAAIAQLLSPIDVHHFVYLGVVSAQATTVVVMVWLRRRRGLAAPWMWVWLAAGMVLSAAMGVAAGATGVSPIPPSNSLIVGGSALSLICYGVFAAAVAFPLASVAALRVSTLAMFGAFSTMSISYVWLVTQRPHGQLIALAVIAVLSALVVLQSVINSSRVFRRLGRHAERTIGWSAFVFCFGQSMSTILRVEGVASTIRPASIVAANGLLIAAMASRSGHLVGTTVTSLSDRHHRSPLLSGSLITILLGNAMFVELSRAERGIAVIVGLTVGVVLQVALFTWAFFELLSRGTVRSIVRRRRAAWRVRRSIDTGSVEVRFGPVMRFRDAVFVAVKLDPSVADRRGTWISGPALWSATGSARRLLHLDEMLMRRAARERAQLVDESGEAAAYVSVRLWSDGLDRPGWCQVFAAYLETERLSAVGLVIEIPAAYLSSHWDNAARSVEELRELGCLVAIADFGAGPANLSLLSRLTFDILAFDPQLVELAATTQRGAAVAHAAIREARHAEVRVVAAGVRDPSWVPELARLGFDYAIGPAINPSGSWRAPQSGPSRTLEPLPTM